MRSTGFLATREYILTNLREKTDFDVEVQEFPYRSEQIIGEPVLQQTAPAARAFTYSRRTPQFRSMTYSGSGDKTAALHGPPNGLAAAHPQHHGCAAADFAGPFLSQVVHTSEQPSMAAE